MNSDWQCPSHAECVLEDVLEERVRQTEKWGEQHHPDGTGDEYIEDAREYKAINDGRAGFGLPAVWDYILLEEVYEALAETDPARLRAELVQVAAVATAWIEDIDSREVSCE